MPYHIPLDIQEEIIKRLPIKSVIEFRSVSKLWKSLIDSSRFINEYRIRQTHPGYVLLNFVSFFKRWKKVKLPNNPSILRSSQGLVYRHDYEAITDNDYKTNNAILWDPLTRKCVAINLPDALGSSNDTIFKTIIGFGVCRQTNDPKLVKITSTRNTCVIDSLSCWQVEVFSLSYRTWKTQSIAWNLLDVDEFSYWLAFDGKTLDAEFQWYYLVMSIDMTSEEFKQVHSLTSEGVDIDLFISKFRQPLVVLETNLEAEKQVYGLWMKKKRVPISFKKLFKISTREASITTVSGFRTSGGNINEDLALFFYKRYSNDIKCIWIDGRRYSFFVCRSMDQLFLLDHY